MPGIHPFDLQARAEAAAWALTALLDPQRDGLMYFLGNWRARPPRAEHSLWDCGDGSGRHLDALTLARAMVRQGSPAAGRTPQEEQIEEWVLRFLGNDGLSWLPAEPWAEPWGKEFLMARWQPGQPAAEISWAQRGTLMGLTSRFQSTGDERYLQRVIELIDGLRRIAIRHEDGLFFPEAYYQHRGWGCDRPGLYPGLEEYNAVLVAPAVRLYEVAGYEPALALAQGLFSYALRHTQGYQPDGSFRLPPPGTHEIAHFHTRTSFALGALRLGLATGRSDYVAWAQRAYEHAKSWGTDFGWFPEGLGLRHGELCCTTDMIELALLLGRHLDPAYWADAERYGRNNLLESQYLSAAALQQAVDRLPEDPSPSPWEGRYSSTRDVVTRQVGVFASRPALNDALHLDSAGMMQCCNAAGARALYDLWRYAIEERCEGPEPLLTVHLRFSVETPSLRVISHEPAVGRLEIRPRHASQIAVRLPQGETQAALLVHKGESLLQAHSLQATGGYARFALGPGEHASISYGLPERSTSYQVGRPGREASGTGHWRGETLMRIEPAGQHLPLYNRRSDLGPAQPGLPAGPVIDSL